MARADKRDDWTKDRALYKVDRLRKTLTVTFRDTRTGIEYPTRAALEAERRRYRGYLLTHFESELADGKLGLDPWDRLPFDTPTSYERFKVYLHMARTHPVTGRVERRSLAAVERTLNLRPGTITHLASRHFWKLRADCWDREVDRQLAEEFLEAKRLSVRRQARLGQKMQQLAERVVDNNLASGAIDVAPEVAVRMAKEGMTIERLAHDQSTRNEAVRTETRLVWAGPAPKWAAHSEEVIPAPQITSGDPDTTPSPTGDD